MATTNQERLPATAEFDARLSKMYDKAFTEVARQVRKSVSALTLDLSKILLPTTDEQEEKRLARKFTKRRLKILDSIDTLVRGLVTGRNRVSLFDMFDTNNPMSQSYVRRYNKVKMNALNRLETGVSLIKFERQQDIPLSTILFPSRNSKLYVARYELLKQNLLTKVHKGIKHLEFTAPTKHRSFRLTKIEKTRAEVPIDAFLIPTPNTNFYAMRYNWSKHVLLSKIHKGIKNMEFTAPVVHKSFKLTKIEKTRADVPIDQFLIPSGNTWYYSAKYELAKLKLLKKVKKGIDSIKFVGGEYDILDKMMPDEFDGADISAAIAKSMSRAINRESKARTKALARTTKTNEYNQSKADSKMDYWIHLDEARNKMMMEGFFGKRGAPETTDMKQGPDGVWQTSRGLNSGGIAQALIAAGPKIGKAIGPTLAVAAAGVIGYELGRYIDKKLGISTGVGNAAGAVTEMMGKYEFTQDMIAPSIKRNPELGKIYKGILQKNVRGGERRANASQKIEAFKQATQIYGKKRNAALSANADTTMNGPSAAEVRTTAMTTLPTMSSSNPNALNSLLNAPMNNETFRILEKASGQLIESAEIMKSAQKNVIINPRPNNDYGYGFSLDSILGQ